MRKLSEAEVVGVDQTDRHEKCMTVEKDVMPASFGLIMLHDLLDTFQIPLFGFFIF